MSGRGDGFPDLPPRVPCRDLAFEAELTGVDPAVAVLVTKGEELPIGLSPDLFPVVMRGDDTLGAVPSGQLTQCVRDGEPFLARILLVDGGFIQVAVRHA